MENQQTLNLARRLRPKSFTEIIGQTFSVKMLQNGLYLNRFFPVYLFAGQRGCGKTTTARIFAAAVNCQNLEQFQKHPDQFSVPCLTCPSCESMQTGQHPDFIEIDAASHTGVDNVRQILESCAYLPLTGRKKIYLIDEAHMLSKAAFNAFLKVLEEPPVTALFILATTEAQKIPVTVRSRCFQAFFKALPHEDLKNYLLTICADEGITISDEAVDIILQETEGSARDALNLLEQVRAVDTTINEESLHQVLGIVSKKAFFELFSSIISQEPGQLLTTLETINFATTSPAVIWNMLVELIRALVRIKYKAPLAHALFSSDCNTLHAMAEKCTVNRLHAMLQLLWSQEELFLKTHQKHLLLEHIMLQLCEQINVADIKELLEQTTPGAAPRQPQAPASKPTTFREQRPYDSAPTPTVVKAELPQPPIAQQAPQALTPVEISSHPMSSDNRWLQFVEQVHGLGDFMLTSIFKQATNKGLTPDEKQIQLSLSNGSQFFKDKVADTQPLWLPILQKAYPGVENFQIESNSQQIVKRPLSAQTIPSTPSNAGLAARKPLGQQAQARSSGSIDISDSEKWPQANLLIEQFPGTLEKVKDRSS